MSSDPPSGLEPGDLELLVRVVGWKRMVLDHEMPAAARLVAAGFLVLEHRGAEPWAEATELGLERRGLGGDQYSVRVTMGGFFGRRGSKAGDD